MGVWRFGVTSRVMSPLELEAWSGGAAVSEPRSAAASRQRTEGQDGDWESEGRRRAAKPKQNTGERDGGGGETWASHDGCKLTAVETDVRGIGCTWYRGCRTARGQRAVLDTRVCRSRPAGRAGSERAGRAWRLLPRLGAPMIQTLQTLFQSQPAREPQSLSGELLLSDGPKCLYGTINRRVNIRQNRLPAEPQA
jgi:hypothetical protein